MSTSTARLRQFVQMVEVTRNVSQIRIGNNPETLHVRKNCQSSPGVQEHLPLPKKYYPSEKNDVLSSVLTGTEK